jgi:ferredoxin
VLGSNGVPEILGSCIGCGLCALSCPVGAIHTGLGQANVIETDERLVRELSDKSEFGRLREQILGPTIANPDEIRATARELASSTRLLKQAAFYPLIAGLFRLLGERVFRPPTGDTNNRIDLILPHGEETIAIEVKSATETVSLNVKSITQALENKVVLRQRKFFPTSSDTSSLVVGFEYPADRSEVQSIINDFWNAYGIRIGMLTVEDLFVEVLTCSIQKSRFERERLTRLLGEFR